MVRTFSLAAFAAATIISTQVWAQPGEGGPRRGPRDGFRPPIIAALDEDGDGEISAKEIADAAKNLAKLDKNEDGKLTLDELRPPGFERPGRGEGRPGPPRGEGRPGPGHGEGRPGAGRPMGSPEQMVAKLFEHDKNEDGKITADELPEHFSRMLQHADKDNDQAIDKAEALAFAKLMAERFREGGGPRGPRPEGGPRGGPRPEGGRPAPPERQ